MKNIPLKRSGRWLAALACLPAVLTAGPPPRPGLPDLIAYVDDDGTVLVKNIGSEVLVPFSVRVKCRVLSGGAPACGAPFQAGSFTATVTLKPGAPAPVKPAAAPKVVVESHPGSAVIGLPVAGWPEGRYEITALADSANAVAEGNETNNSATAVVTVPKKN